MDFPRLLSRLGWLFFALTFVSMGVMFVSLSGLPEGDFAWEELPPLFRVPFVSMMICLGGCLLGLIGSPVAAGLRNRRLKAHGESAKAVILGTRETGTRINDNPVVRFTLEVHAPDGQVFQAAAERLVSIVSLPQFQPGAIVPVKYDPVSRKTALDL